MTALQMKREFEVLFDRAMSNGAPSFSNSRLTTILTHAEENVVYRKAPNLHRNERISKEVGRLIRPAELTPSTSVTGLFPNGVYFEIADNILRVSTEEILVESDDECIDNTRIPVRPITLDQYTENLENPFWMPDESVAWRIDMGLDSNNSRLHQIITGSSYTVLRYYILYLLKPGGIEINSSTNNSLNTDSLTDDSLHREIVREAVRIASASVLPEEYKIKMQEQQINNQNQNQ